MKLPFRTTLARYRRALRYALGTWDAYDAATIDYECHRVTGSWPLECVDFEGVMELVADAYSGLDDAMLEEYARDAVSRVASKWSSSGDAAGAAQDWAVDLVREYAEQDGIELKEAA